MIFHSLLVCLLIFCMRLLAKLQSAGKNFKNLQSTTVGGCSIILYNHVRRRGCESFPSLFFGLSILLLSCTLSSSATSVGSLEINNKETFGETYNNRDKKTALRIPRTFLTSSIADLFSNCLWSSTSIILTPASSHRVCKSSFSWLPRRFQLI